MRGRQRVRTDRATNAAQNRLRSFRQASILAVTLTAFLLMVFAPGEASMAQEEGAEGADTALVAIPEEPAEDPDIRADALLRETTDTARDTARDLWIGFVSGLPRFAVALFIFLLAWLFVRGGRTLLRRALRGVERGDAFIALYGIVVWALAFGMAVSVVAGDVRALLGSIGLIGLALSWALQTPIESFTGWLLNSFQGYYRVGDRVAVGDVFGDVYRIDFLTTTVWEIGSPGRGFVSAEQPTGRLITFPNNEVLAGSIVNLTRDFPYVWDELAIQVANESDLPYARGVILRVAERALGDYMKGPSEEYERILQRARLEFSVARTPEVFVSLADSWTDITVRYLVGARERRRWKSLLAEEITIASSKPEHVGRIIPVYPRQQLQAIDRAGNPVDWPTRGEAS